MSGSRSGRAARVSGLLMEASPGSFVPTASTAASCRWCLRFSGAVNQSGPLPWPDRELIAATTSRLNQCFY